MQFGNLYCFEINPNASIKQTETLIKLENKTQNFFWQEILYV